MAGMGTGGGNKITVLNPDNSTARIIDASVKNSANPSSQQAPGIAAAANFSAQSFYNNGTMGGPAATLTNPLIGSAGSASGAADKNYTGRAFMPATSGGGGGGSSVSRDVGTFRYTGAASGGGGFNRPIYQRIDPATGKMQTYGLGGSSEEAQAAKQAAEAGRATGEGMMAEALGLQKNIEAFMNLSAQIRKLGIDDKLVKTATNNLMAMLDGSTTNDSWLKNAAFKSNVNFVQDQMTRKLSPYGYAPGEHSYGDNTIAQATGAMAQDWTKFWFDSNMGIVNAGNQLGQIGAQGQMAASEQAVNLNPAGLFASGGVAEAVAAANPMQAWSQWQQRNGDWMKKFNLPGA